MGEPLPTDGRHYTVREAARLLSVHRSSIQRRIRSGELPAQQVAGAWRIPRDALHEALDSRQPDTTPQPMPAYLQDLFNAWRRSRGPQDTRLAWEAYLQAWRIANEEA